MQVMDSEISAKCIKTIMEKWKSKYQLVPLDMHRQNAAEWAIRTMKAYFPAIRASFDPGFPKLQWDLLLPQAELTINLIRQSQYDPTKTAWEA